MAEGALVVLRPWSASDGHKGNRLYMWCPACDKAHAVELEGMPQRAWTWNGDMAAPTIDPSIKVTGVQWWDDSVFHKPNHQVAAGAKTVCHSFVRSGRWEFLTDCTHGLAGQTVDMVPVPDWLGR